jgi:hypothetical protein
MLRRLIAVGFAAAMAAPLLSVAPAHAAVLFSCSSVTGSGTLTPGLSTNPTLQTDVSALVSVSGCSNGQTASIGVGTGAGLNVVKSVAGKPINCASNYANNVKIIAGNTFPNMQITWSSGPVSQGLTTIKGSGTAAKAKAVLKITSGQYAPAKFKVTFTFAPTNGACSDASPTTTVSLTNSGNGIVQT